MHPDAAVTCAVLTHRKLHTFFCRKLAGVFIRIAIRNHAQLMGMKALAACLAFLFLGIYCQAATRHYYIAAEDVSWDYAPSKRDLISGSPLPLPWRDRTEWPKTRFIEYTDATFSVRKPQPPWLGILGPVIRGEVGDEIVVDFLNRSKIPHNIHPHGLRYDKANEGSFYLPMSSGSRVLPGHRFTYHWFADEGSGPGPGQLSSVVWWYHPHIDPETEINSGLLGPIIITARGKANPDGSPKGVDREFVASFMIFDQLAGKDNGLYYAINGYIFGNLPGLMMKQGERVRWYLLGMGNEKDIHTPHWHGKTVTDGVRNTDVVELLPGATKTVDMIADNPGTWLFHCHVSDHMEAGMMAVYIIYPPPPKDCPLQFLSGDFWNPSGKMSLKVKNVSGKPIKKYGLNSEYLLTPQFLRRPYDSDWLSTAALAPGEEQTLNHAGIATDVIGVVFFPYSVHFEDGSVWRPKEPGQGQCFGVLWRDKDYPDLPALPPLQIEMRPD